MRLFKNWAKTFGESEDINPDSEMLVSNFKNFLSEQNNPESIDFMSYGSSGQKVRMSGLIVSGKNLDLDLSYNKIYYYGFSMIL